MWDVTKYRKMSRDSEQLFGLVASYTDSPHYRSNFHYTKSFLACRFLSLSFSCLFYLDCLVVAKLASSFLQFCLPVTIFGSTLLLLRVQNTGIFFSLLLVIMNLSYLPSLKILHWFYFPSMILLK